MKRFVQFIAGAICPECKSKDTIALNPSDDEIYCVKCNFIEKRPELKDIKKDAEIKVVNIKDFKKNRDKNQ
jgi:uncharacterized metal-binding protein (TIGR02443 family)